MEDLHGENRYRAPGFGLQEAKRGTRFTRFPHALQIQLKRWEARKRWGKKDEKLGLDEFRQFRFGFCVFLPSSTPFLVFSTSNILCFSSLLFVISLMLFDAIQFELHIFPSSSSPPPLLIILFFFDPFHHVARLASVSQIRI